MTLFQIESYDEVIDDLKPLLTLHHSELALYQNEILLDPDWEFYKRANELGILRGYTARLNDGELIGYATFAVRDRHSHYSHRWAVNDVLFVAPKHRNMGTGNGLFDCFEEDLRAGGPIVIHIETKAEHPELAFLCKARGYGLVGPSYSKRFT